jgi:hypothetical protein
VSSAGPTRRARRNLTDPERAGSSRAAPLTHPAPIGWEEIDVALADLAIIVPAVLAGVGGVLLGDKAGLWLKTALAGRKRD